MFKRVCELHKRIMKNDVSAIDDIETLEEAKEIIKMLASNIVGQMYFNGQIYSMTEYVKEDV